MIRKLCQIGLAATLVLGLLPAAAGAEISHFQFRGRSAYAGFTDTDSMSCISTSVSVSLYENRFQQMPGPPQPEAALEIYFSQYDYCQNAYLFSGGGWAPLPAQAFDISQSLQSASVTATIDVFDGISGAQNSVTIDLDWTGVGETFHGISRNQTITPHYKHISRSSGSNREAQVSGTILLGTKNLAAGSSWASLYSSQSGYLSIWR